MTTILRNSLQVTFSVWRAMFLREALDRLFEARGAWLWLLFEPVMWILLHVVYYFYAKHTSIGGEHVCFWTAAGFVAFILWRRTYIQALHAVDCNKAYFVYRQVKPFDAALIRGFLELFLIFPIAAIVFSLIALSGFSILPGLIKQQFVPGDPLLLLTALVGLWLLGLGVGLILSVLMIFVPEINHINNLIYLPLYVLCGAMYPVAAIPMPYRTIWLINPVVHGVESVRLGFLPSYHTDPVISLTYLFFFALGAVFLGLVLYRRFDKKLVMR
jgi:capsular polysaccharide transport system permease protein